MGLPEILGSERLWPIAFGFPGLLALFLVCALPFCPESPKFLLVSSKLLIDTTTYLVALLEGKREEAKQVLNTLVNEEEARKMFEGFIKEAALSQEGLGTFKELFTLPCLRIPLVVSILMMFAQQLTGCGAVFAYSTDMFKSAQLTPKAARFSTLAVGIAYFLFACSAPFLIERLGRRRLSLFQLSMVAVSLSLLSVFSYIQNVRQVTIYPSSWQHSHLFRVPGLRMELYFPWSFTCAFMELAGKKT